MNLGAIADSIEALTPVDEREAASITATLERLRWPIDPFDEFAHDHEATTTTSRRQRSSCRNAA